MGRVTGERRGRARFVAISCVALVVLAGCMAPAAPPKIRILGRGVAAPSTARAGGGSERILLFGDSLLWQAARPLERDLRAHGMSATVTNAAVVGSGLLHPVEGTTPVEHLRRTLDAKQPTTVVFEYSGNYEPSASVPPLGSEAFYDAWIGVAADLTRLARSHGATVYWVIPPPRFPDAVATDELAERYRTFLPTQVGVRVIDWWTPFVDVETDEYANYLDIGGETVRVRNKSVIHFTHEGAERAARWLADAIRTEWPAS
jgi:hypothetical protein